MLKKRIIPCLDVKEGRVVKGINFVNLSDAGDPVEQATVYDKQGADEICFLDIMASSDNRDIILSTVNKAAKNISHSKKAKSYVLIFIYLLWIDLYQG